MTSENQVYLAGPEVFHFEAQQRIDKMRETCKELGLTPLTPLDHLQETSEAIYKQNTLLIEQSALMIVNISPFRGISLDPGCAFEIGYAAALGKPIIAWSMDRSDYLSRTSGAYGGNLRQDDKGVWRDPTADEVENFGLADNLMIVVPALATTGIIHPNFQQAAEKAAEFFKVKAAFLG
ncbi:MAG: nucleoside 2-deoxyribosyltransferase [Rhodospirillales bacterium]|nr:nucleoside 2-deoxyribosyltransferase [Rhodospirillales bacterium]